MPYSAPDAVYCSNNLNYNENRYLIENISDPIVSQSLLSMDMTNEQTASGTNSQALNKQINYSRYKTELCRQFSENGECKYGDKCQFAHGINDLKDVNRHPKYKTDYCKTFHSKGFCPYGPRCHFIHEFYEKSTEIATHQVFKSFKNKYEINMNKKPKSFKPGFQSASLTSSSHNSQKGNHININSNNNNKYNSLTHVNNDFNDYRLTSANSMPKDDSSSSMSTTSVSSCLSCSSSLSSSSSSSSSSQSQSPSPNYSSSSSSLSLSNNRSIVHHSTSKSNTF
jgi:hypothetical protein